MTDALEEYAGKVCESAQGTMLSFDLLQVIFVAFNKEKLEEPKE
jgi:hypothetical protein